MKRFCETCGRDRDVKHFYHGHNHCKSCESAGATERRAEKSRDISAFRDEIEQDPEIKAMIMLMEK